MKTYQRAFILALAGNIVLIGSLVALWWHYRMPHAATNEPSMGANEVGTSATPAEVASASTEIPLDLFNPHRHTSRVYLCCA